MSYWIYMLQCKDGTYYTGMTDDVEKRLAVHNARKGAKYTRGRTPLEIVYRQECADRSEALKREAEIKKLTRKEKVALIEGRLTLLPSFVEK